VHVGKAFFLKACQLNVDIVQQRAPAGEKSIGPEHSLELREADGGKIRHVTLLLRHRLSLDLVSVGLSTLFSLFNIG
jgi:hypothetical protein